MIRLLFASQNAHKIAEVRTLLSDLPVTLVLPADIGISPSFDVAETGVTFAQNAELKARGFAGELYKNPSYSDVLVVAEDSGLVVPSLGGQPGVQSKRFAPGSDHDRNLLLLQKLNDPSRKRDAFFIAVLCLLQPHAASPVFFEGKVTGTIAHTELGAHTFGYDPVFIPDGSTKSFAQLSAAEKNDCSHRARAFAHLKEALHLL